jgi:ABC-type uncharacterized transport system ATPase subunit
MERVVTMISDHVETSNGAPYLLVAEKLQKTYDNKVALKGLSFSLRPGRIMGFLGPNGAGKTTAIRILIPFRFVDGIMKAWQRYSTHR